MIVRLAAGASAATGLAIAVVAGAGQAADASSLPPFTHAGERFDQSHFQGRWMKMLSNFDPTTLISSDAEVKKAVDLLKNHKLGLIKGETDANLWAARKLRDSAVHPDTGDIIPRPFRMAGYVPFNGPVCIFMMISSTVSCVC